MGATWSQGLRLLHPEGHTEEVGATSSFAFQVSTCIPAMDWCVKVSLGFQALAMVFFLLVIIDETAGFIEFQVYVVCVKKMLCVERTELVDRVVSVSGEGGLLIVCEQMS